MADSNLILRGGILLSPGKILRADILIRGGRIERIGTFRDARAVRIDATDCWVLPGLIQTHVHLCQTLFRGMADDLALLPWLRRRIWPLEASLDAQSIGAAARLGLLELLLGGTTTILDMGTVHHQDVVFEAMKESGIRGFSGKAMMDRGDGIPSALKESTVDSLRETQALARRWHDPRGRIGYAVAPRFILSSSRQLLEGVRELATLHGLLIHTHASEHADECAAVHRATRKNNVEALHEFGITGGRSVFAHGVHLSSRERALLASSQTSIAHCPSANMKLGSGMADVVALHQAGVNVGLGADGAACNNLLDAWTEMRLAGLIASVCRRPGALSARRLFRMATLDGARALGLEREIGSIEVGKRADLIVVDPGMQGEPVEDPWSRLVWSGRATDVRDVIVDGRVVVRNRRCLTLEAPRARREARRQANRLRLR